MRSVARKTRAEIDTFMDAVRDAAVEVNEQHSAVSASLSDLVRPYSDAVARYNEAVTDLNDALSHVVDDINEFVAAKSHQWQQSEAAQRYVTWKSQIEEAKLSEVNPLDGFALEDPDVVEPEEMPPMSLEEVG